MGHVLHMDNAVMDGSRVLVRSFDGTCLRATVSGPRDGTAIVMCHGIGLSVRSWGRVPEILAARHRVITYDLRGHGASAPAAGGDYSLDAHGRDLDAVLATVLSGEEAAVAVGHSLGGGLVLAHVRRAGHRHRLAGAVFIATSGASKSAPGLPRSDRGSAANRGIRTAWLLGLRGLAALVHAACATPALGRRLVRWIGFPGDAPGSGVRLTLQQLVSTRRDVLTRTAAAALAVDPTEWAGGLRVPAVVLAGGEDHVTELAEARRLVAALPLGRLIEVPTAAHMIARTEPERAAAEIAGLVRRVGESRRDS